MSVFVGGYKWIGLTVAMLVLSSLLSGCMAITDQGVVFTIRPIVDYRVPAPAVVELLDEIEAETGEACIDLNSADAETLQNVVNIGPYRAGYIADLRDLFEFDSVDDLRIVPGIGERRLAQIKEQGLICDLSGKG